MTDFENELECIFDSFMTFSLVDDTVRFRLWKLNFTPLEIEYLINYLKMVRMEITDYAEDLYELY
jgi:hypothetical protein